MEHESLLAITHAGLQVHNAARAEMQQLLGGHLAERCGRAISGVDPSHDPFTDCVTCSWIFRGLRCSVASERCSVQHCGSTDVGS
jgi:hypothetical protein